MEYVQMTLDDWMEMKQKLKRELLGVKQSFVRIGYALRKIEDQRLYEQDGYKSITEFAKAEYGLEPSTTSRFMSINREYSIDGYSETLRPEYAELGRSQLEEMLKLPDGDRQMVRPETSREDIRELKRFNKTTPAEGESTEITGVIEKFYEENPEILNKLYESGIEFSESAEKLIEIVNPGGNKTFRKGMYFLMMYEDTIKVKKFGSQPQNMPWEEFLEITKSIFMESADGSRTWKNHFGGSEEPESPKAVKNQSKISEEIKENSTEEKQERFRKDERDTEIDEVTPSAEKNEEISKQDTEKAVKNHSESTEKLGDEGKTSETEKEKGERLFQEVPSGSGQEIMNLTQGQQAERETIAPAQKTAERLKENGILDRPEVEEITKEEYESIVRPDKLFGTRKQYLDSLTEYGMADYMAKSFRNVEGPESLLTPNAWEKWLNREVDGKGRAMKVARNENDE